MNADSVVFTESAAKIFVEENEAKKKKLRRSIAIVNK